MSFIVNMKASLTSMQIHGFSLSESLEMVQEWAYVFEFWNGIAPFSKMNVLGRTQTETSTGPAQDLDNY